MMIKENELPDGWKIYKLKDIGTVVTGSTPPKKDPNNYGGVLPWIKPPDLDKRKFVNKSNETISEAGKRKVRLLPAGTVLVSCIGNIGKMAIAECELCTNQQINSIIPNENIVNSIFLYHTIKRIKPYLENTASSAVVPLINKKDFSNVEIALPSLPTQAIIVDILEKAEMLREWRSEADELTDEFLRCMFLEMFGESIQNPKGWNTMNIGNVCSELYRYPTFYGFEYTETGVPIVRIMNILANGSLDPDVSNYVCFDAQLNKKFPRTILEYHDIVMAVRGDGSTAKRIGLVDNLNLVGANMSPNLIRFKADKKIVDPIYLFNLMTSQGGQQLLGKYVKRTAKKTITAGDIKKIVIPIPPIELQNKFADIVQQVEQMRTYQNQSKQHIDDLFNVLMQKAFKGELM